MRGLFFILRSISFGVAIICAIYIIGFIIDKVKHNDNNSHTNYKLYQIIILFSILASIIISAPFQELFRIDNLSFKPEGEYCYYVLLENDYGTEKLTVPARIDIKIETDSDDGTYGESRTVSIIHYHLDEVYLDDKTLFFLDEHELKVNKPKVVCDENNNYWICTLLNERAYYPRLKFNNGITAFNVTLLCIKLVVLISTLVLLEIEKRKALQSIN